jgi:Rad51
MAVKGIDLETISQLVLKAKCKLIEDGLLQEDFSSAEKILERRQKMVKFSTGSDSFDSFLGGGIETQALTEIAGEFGSGKSQLCYTLCVTANMSSSGESNKDCGVIFVDTENSFKAERINQIAESRGLDAEEIVRRLIEKALDIGIRKVTGMKKMQGIYLLEEPVPLYRCEQAKLYLGFSIQVVNRRLYQANLSLACLADRHYQCVPPSKDCQCDCHLRK